MPVKKSLRIPKNLSIEEEQRTQWSKEKVQKDKQRSTKHTHKTKDSLITNKKVIILISCGKFQSNEKFHFRIFYFFQESNCSHW